jgi:hypothetical protein
MFSWIYDIPNSLFFFICVIFFTIFSCLGVIFTRPWARKVIGFDAHQNDAISYFFAGIGAIYGISLGLIAVGVWTTFNNIDDKVSAEAAAIATLYSNFEGYPDSTRMALTTKLKTYTDVLIKEAWPLQQKGQSSTAAATKLHEMQTALYAFEPRTNGQNSIHRQTIGQFDVMVTLARQRVAAINTSLSPAVWWVLLIGAFICLIFTWLFVLEKTNVHVMISGLIGALIGSLIFLIAAMDNPFKGDFSISSDAIQLVYEQMMK